VLYRQQQQLDAALAMNQRLAGNSRRSRPHRRFDAGGDPAALLIMIKKAWTGYAAALSAVIVIARWNLALGGGFDLRTLGNWIVTARCCSPRGATPCSGASAASTTGAARAGS